MWKEIINDPKVLVAIGTTIIAIIAVQGLINIQSTSITKLNDTLNKQVEVQRQMTQALEANTQVTSQFQGLLLKVVNNEVSLKN